MNDSHAKKILRIPTSTEEEVKRLDATVAAMATAHLIAVVQAPASLHRSAIALIVSLLMAISLHAQSTGQKPIGSSNESAPFVSNVNGQSVPLDQPYFSLPSSADRLTILLTSEPGKRMRFLLDGVEPRWREGPGDMVFGVRFFDSNGEQIKQESFQIIGESAGWTGDLQKPVFVHHKEPLVAPPRAASFWIVISSAGPPETLGALIVKNVVVSHVVAGGASEVMLRAPIGLEPSVTSYLAPAGFCADGTRPSMASLLLPVSASSNSQSECFVIVDSDMKAHAEWHTLKEVASRVSENEPLVVEWDEAYSIGLGGSTQLVYKRPPAGFYQLRAQTVDFLGRPTGAATSLVIRIPPPWWQRAWVWICAFGAALAATVITTRFIAHRRMREQLIHLKEEQLVERERLRIARDIHDTLAQGFTGVIVQLEAAEDAQSRGLARETIAHLKRAGDLARGSLQEARRSVRALREQTCEQKRLPDALGALLEKMTSGAAMRAKLIVDGKVRRLAPEAEENLLHIGQEALVNALRHAHASEFTVRLAFESQMIRLELQDDGSGFDQAAAHDGFGLIGMKERAQAMGGDLSIQSTTMGGTTISLVLPISCDGQSGK